MSYIDVLKDSAFKDALIKELNSRMAAYAENALLAWADEDAVTQAFISAVSGHFSHSDVSIELRGYKVRGRGPAPPELLLGADGLGLVFVNTSQVQLRGFYLFQAKKALNTTDAIEARVKLQCEVMLKTTAASQLLVLLPKRVAFVGAIAVTSTVATSPRLSELPYGGFPHLVITELLCGLMMSPLDGAPFQNNKTLLQEISNILVILAADTAIDPNDDTDTRSELAALGFDDDDLTPLKNV